MSGEWCTHMGICDECRERAERDPLDVLSPEQREYIAHSNDVRRHWQRFTDEELHAISSALWTTSEMYPRREDHAVMVELRGQTTPLVKRRAARAHQTQPGLMTFTTMRSG